MDFLKKLLNQSKSSQEETNNLKVKISKALPHINDDNELLKITGMAGLLARVAFSDSEIDNKEIQSIEKALLQWTSISAEQTKDIAQMILNAYKELAGIENHQYTDALFRLLNEDERYEFLEVLFEVAASDQNVDNIESEEIRVITKGLRLSHRHFISARAKVLEHLKALK